MANPGTVTDSVAEPQAKSCYAVRHEVAMEDFETGSLAFLSDRLRLVQLNPVARDVLALLDGNRTVRDIAVEIADLYEQPFERVLTDIAKLLRHNEAQGLVERHSAVRKENFNRDDIKHVIYHQPLIEGIRRQGMGRPDPGGIWGLHASAVVSSEGVLLFLGPSGTGKSTILRLLNPHFIPLAEDAVYLIPAADGSWRVADAGYPQPTMPLTEITARTLRSVPLRAIFRLNKNHGVYLNETDALAGCRHLMSGIFELIRQLSFSQEVRRRCFRDMAAISRRYPVFHLEFNLSDEVGAVFAARYSVDQTPRSGCNENFSEKRHQDSFDVVALS